MFEVHSVTTPHHPATKGQYLSMYHRLHYLTGMSIQPMPATYWGSARMDISAMPNEDFGIEYENAESVPIEVIFDYPESVALESMDADMLGVVARIILDDIKSFIRTNLPKQETCLCSIIDDRGRQLGYCQGGSTTATAVAGGRVHKPTHTNGIFIVGTLSTRA